MVETATIAPPPLLRDECAPQVHVLNAVPLFGGQVGQWISADPGCRVDQYVDFTPLGDEGIDRKDHSGFIRLGIGQVTGRTGFAQQLHRGDANGG